MRSAGFVFQLAGRSFLPVVSMRGRFSFNLARISLLHVPPGSGFMALIEDAAYAALRPKAMARHCSRTESCSKIEILARAIRACPDGKNEKMTIKLQLFAFRGIAKGRCVFV